MITTHSHRTTMHHLTRLVFRTLVLLGLLIGGLSVSHAGFVRSAGIPYQVGDVFVGVGAGHISHFSPTGTLLDTLNTGGGNREDTGMCFDASGDLYATNFSGTPSSMTKFDSQGNVLTFPWGGPFSTNPESCVVDNAGDIYVGEVDGANLLRKFDAAGHLLATYSPTRGARGIDWIDLAADQCTIYYTSESSTIGRFNVCTNTQLPDFATGLPAPCYALRIRPDGEVMVACQTMVLRLDAVGNRVQSYTPGTGESLFALNIDPDGTSFWTAGYTSGHVFKVDIASGTVLTTLTVAFSFSIAGLAIFGEPTVGCTTCGVTPTATATGSPPAATATPTATAPEATETETPQATETETETPQATQTEVEPTATETQVEDATKTPTPIQTATPTRTPSPSRTPTGTPTRAPSGTPTASATPNANAPSLTLSRTSGRFKDLLAAQGAHFGGHEPITLYLDSTTSTPLTSTSTGGGGTFSATVSVPQAISGTHTIVAVGQSSGDQARAPFTILPGTTLLHYQGYKGTQDVLRGAGFAPHEVVHGFWASPGGAAFPISATTNSIGTFGGSSSFPGITFTVPLSPTGAYGVYAVGQTSGGVAHSTFTLNPHLQLTPNSGPAGSLVKVVGTGYGASESVSLKYNCGTSGCTSTTILATPSTDANGFFSIMVPLPSSTSLGTHSIGGAGGSSGVFATASFTVTS